MSHTGHKLELHHALPWSFGELLIVDGMRCVYSAGDTGWVVHFPGGGKRPLRELQIDGHDIHVPHRWRTGSYA